MNKQELIKSISEMSVTPVQENRNSILRLPYVSQTAVLGMVRELEEPQKVVIPRFVAEWIEENQKYVQDLKWVFNAIPDDRKVYEWMKENSLLFFRAWLDGYEIEQEKLYTVEIPNPNSHEVAYALIRNDEEKNVRISMICRMYWKDIKNYHLTEAEIKEDFEWAWQFAEEVE